MSHLVNDITEPSLSGPESTPAGEPVPSNTARLIASLLYGLLLVGFWFAAKANPIGSVPHFAAVFSCFGVMLAPLWFAGFGLADTVATWLASPVSRVVGGASLGVPYLISSVPQSQFQWKYFIALVLLPVGLSALVGLRTLPQRLNWRDVVVLAILAFTLMSHSLSGAWPQKGLGSLPKLYLCDVAIYVFLIARRLRGVGYSFVPSWSAVGNGARNWLYFAPIGIGLGLALHFITFFPRSQTPLRSFALFAGIFLLTAVPEEFFFRGVLQNLLEPVIGRTRSLIVASVLFGLSHFPKGPTAFNWRYVILAAIAGIFYGRAWRARRQLLASSITHASVDTVWSLWFR